MSWNGYPEEDPSLLDAQWEADQERAYAELRRENAEKELAEMEKYYEHYFSIDGWIDRMYDELIKSYGD